MTYVTARLSLVAALFGSLLLGSRPASAQGTAFTYQGRLTDGAGLANGSYDLTFSVWNAVSGPAQVGGIVASPATPVTNGLFTVNLDFGAGVFTGAERWLEIAARTAGGGAFDTLAPRQPINATPYAIRALSASTATTVTGPIDGGLIAAGTLTGAKLAYGAAAANLAALGQAAVASGGLVLAIGDNAGLVSAGYVRIPATVTTDDIWQQRGTATPLAARSDHTAVWTGTEMIVWGGRGGGSLFNDGKRYHPAADTWTAVSTSAAPAARADHTAVWTGTEMIVWGGSGASNVPLADGGRYHPITDHWTAVSTTAAPGARAEHTAVWTGTEMIVWGGAASGGSRLNTGGRYAPAGNSWTAVTTTGAPAARADHTAVWTGTEMLVWGGAASGSGRLSTGGRYDPTANSWTAVANTAAPAARADHTAVWTGTEMIVWGGAGSSVFNDGGRYTPAGNTWTAVTTTAAPASRSRHTAVWTGSEMIVWGGDAGGGTLNDGGRYHLEGNSWTAASTTAAPVGRRLHTVVWTGTEMIIWGGYGTGLYHRSGGRYNPATDSWRPTSLVGAPSARVVHTAVWTGSAMLVWGGSSSGFENDGGRYLPATDLWTPMSTIGAPAERFRHTAVWTGTEMIVWGGSNGSTGHYLGSGGRYNPATDSWSLIVDTLPNTPAARDDHTAVWTGTEMIVWGGIGFGGILNDGARYNPALNSWLTIVDTLPNTPALRHLHSAVWTGTEMIVWGGQGPVPFASGRNDGGRYTPATDSWTAVNTVGAPGARGLHSAVWTGVPGHPDPGDQMIIWGGTRATFLNDGGRYTPALDGWAAGWETVSPTDSAAPSARVRHSTVWTGSEMIVWGGSGGHQFNTGGRYHPAANSWRGVSTTGAPAARYDHTAVWTGSEMIVWGGQSYEGGYHVLDEGGRYDPTSDHWTLIPNTLANTPARRYVHAAVWTGTEMLLWGGFGGDLLNDGGRYDPAANSWTSIVNTLPNTPGPRFGHTSVWTGTEMVIWGGTTSAYGGSLNDGARYNPAGNNWTPVNATGAPGAQYLHTAVWTGAEMIVWGGSYFDGVYRLRNNGGRYDPVSDRWTATVTTGAPAERSSHTAVWTGTEMIVWGGIGAVGQYLDDGGRYNPRRNTLIAG